MSQQKSKQTAQEATLSRRRFMGQTAIAAGSLALPTIIPASALGADGHVAPSNRITTAQIGIGRRGRGYLRSLLFSPSVEVLAICEVDRDRLKAATTMVEDAYADRKNSCVAYHDYQEIMARDDIDAVEIITPDHLHTPISIAAAKAGKDIYCEKPVSIAVNEGRELERTVSQHGRIFQTGTQYRSMPRIRQVCGFVRAGGLGRVKSVFTRWGTMTRFIRQERFKPYLKYFDVEAARRTYFPLILDLPSEPVPEGLDWERWVGPAIWHDYNRLYHTNEERRGVPWSFCKEFGVGDVTGFHSHAADVIQYALGMEESGPVELLHPQDGPYPTLTCRYANGTLLHYVESWEDMKRLYPSAVPDTARLAGNFGGVFVGEKGWVTSMTTGGPIEGGPEDIFAAMEMENREVDTGNDHHANWLECVRTRQRPRADAELGHRAAALGHLTIIAYPLGLSLKWDPVKEVFPDDETANRLLKRTRRV